MALKALSSALRDVTVRSWSLDGRGTQVGRQKPGDPVDRGTAPGPARLGVSKTFRSPHRIDQVKGRLRRVNDLLLSAPEVVPFRHVEAKVTDGPSRPGLVGTVGLDRDVLMGEWREDDQGVMSDGKWWRSPKDG